MAIKDVHTRELLRQLRWASHEYSGEPGGFGFDYPREELKKELATREHIPNKREAAAIRKAKIVRKGRKSKLAFGR